MVLLARIHLVQGALMRLERNWRCTERKKALILTGPKVRALGYADQVAKSVSAAGIEFEIYDKAVVNPTAESVHAAFEYIKDKSFDAIVAVGGGSVEDTGKALKHLYGYPDQKINDIAIGPGFKYYPKNTSVMLITVCTMNGTGCELSAGAVITNPEGQKDSISSGNTIPHKQDLFSGLFASAVVRRNWRSIHDDTAPQSKNSCEVEKTYGKLKNIPYNCRFIRL